MSAQQPQDNSQEQIIPPLREDLEYFPAPDEEDGSPVWMVRDPLHSTFMRATWEQVEIMRRLTKPMHLDQLASELYHNSTIRVSKNEIASFCTSLVKRGLTKATLQKQVELLDKELASKKIHPIKWLLHSYLYFRIPLIHPDAFLEKTLGIVKRIFSWPFFVLYFITLAMGIIILSEQFDAYINTFPRFFSFQGALVYGVSIACVKVIHEFSHAYMAKYFGNRIPTMGLAFIVMWPVPFCDVTDSWRMKERKERLLISGAGILAELMIAGFALFLWGISPEGSIKSICFILSSVTIIGTLFVNLNPGMRFDGYYIFSDIFGIDNMQARSFAMTKWYIRRLMWKIAVPCPEPSASAKRRIIMIIYSIYAWIYRFFLYLGIAVLVYYAFTKVLGIFLFIVEIIFFILRPLYMEFREMTMLRKYIKFSINTCMTVLVLLFLAYWFVAPRPLEKKLSAFTRPLNFQIVYSPFSGVAEDVSVKRGDTVKKGQILFKVIAPTLAAEIKHAKLQIEFIEKEISILATDPQGKAMLPQKQVALTKMRANLRGLEIRNLRNTVEAALDGVVYKWNETTVDGVALYRREEVGRIADESIVILQAYIPENSASDIKGGEEAIFVPKNTLQSIKVKISKVRPLRVPYLEHVGISSLNGGDIAVSPDKRGRLEMIDSYYEVDAEFKKEDMEKLRFGQIGYLYFKTPPKSQIGEFLNHAYRVIMRESNL